MVNLFEDLIPKATPNRGGMFDDLIPSGSSQPAPIQGAPGGVAPGAETTSATFTPTNPPAPRQGSSAKDLLLLPMAGMNAVNSLYGTAGHGANVFGKALESAWTPIHEALPNSLQGTDPIQSIAEGAQGLGQALTRKSEKIAQGGVNWAQSQGANPSSVAGQISSGAGNVLGTVGKFWAMGPYALQGLTAESGINRAGQTLEQGYGLDTAVQAGMVDAATARAIAGMPGGEKAFDSLWKLAASKAARGTAMGAGFGTVDTAIDRLLLGKDVSAKDYGRNVLNAVKSMLAFEAVGGIPQARQIIKNGGGNALQEQGPGSVLQRSPEGTGETGSERGGVEPVQQGDETPGAGKVKTETNPPATEQAKPQAPQSAQEKVAPATPETPSISIKQPDGSMGKLPVPPEYLDRYQKAKAQFDTEEGHIDQMGEEAGDNSQSKAEKFRRQKEHIRAKTEFRNAELGIVNDVQKDQLVNSIPDDSPAKAVISDSFSRPITEAEGQGKEAGKRVHFAIQREAQGQNLATKISSSHFLQDFYAEHGTDGREYMDWLDAKRLGGNPGELSPEGQAYRDAVDPILKALRLQYQESVNNKTLKAKDIEDISDPNYYPRKFLGIETPEAEEPQGLSPQPKMKRGLLRTTAGAENRRTVLGATGPEGERYVVNEDGSGGGSLWKNGEEIGSVKKTSGAGEAPTYQAKIGGGKEAETVDLKGSHATLEEIEQHTPFRYSSDMAGSAIRSLNDLAAANRNQKYLSDLKDSGSILPSEQAPKGWFKFEHPNFPGDYSAPKDIARVLSDHGATLKAIQDSPLDPMEKVKQLGRLSVNLGFIWPSLHLPNEMSHFVAGRDVFNWLPGAGGYQRMAEGFRNAVLAAKTVPEGQSLAALEANINPVSSQTMRNILALGGRAMNLSPERSELLQHYNDAVQSSMAKEPEVWNNWLQKIGGPPLRVLQNTTNAISKGVWALDNAARFTLYLDQLRKAGFSLADVTGKDLTKESPERRQKAIDAIREVDQSKYPDYDIPASGAAGQMSKNMSQSDRYLFVKYHYGALKILKNDIKTVLTPLAKAAKWDLNGADMKNAGNVIMSYGLLTQVVQPMFDKAMQYISGDPNFKMRWGGGPKLVKDFAGLLTGDQRQYGKLMGSIFTQAPWANLAVDLYNNATDPMNGEAIQHASDIRSAKNDFANIFNSPSSAQGYEDLGRHLGHIVVDPLAFVGERFGPMGSISAPLRDFRREPERSAAQKARAELAGILGGKRENPNAEKNANAAFNQDASKLEKERNRNGLF